MKSGFFLLVLVTILQLGAAAQKSKFNGTWQGILDVGNGTELRIVFHVTEDGKGGAITTADSPDQSAYGFACDSTVIGQGRIFIGMKILNASFNGTLKNDSIITGTFIQQIEIPLELKKSAGSARNNRPQTPQPPFSYRSEDVIYQNADKSLQYGATITIPPAKGKFPAVVLITGSGPQDRDETIMGHHPFAVIADHLTKNGSIVLRVDDRGVGKSSGDFSKATTADFAADVHAGIEYLLTRDDVDRKKIGLIGHSEGGMIAPMVASSRKDISYIILMAGPGVKIIDLMAEQNLAVARSSGISEATQKEIKPLFRKVVTAIVEAADSSSAIASVTAITEEWASQTSAAILDEMDFNTAELRSAYIREMIKQFQSPWFSYFIKFDPVDYLVKLKGHVLAINGDKDIQVVADQNLPGIESALKKSSVRSYDIKKVSGLNHLFQKCTKCTVQEYGELEETISPEVLKIMSDWLLNVTR